MKNLIIITMFIAASVLFGCGGGDSAQGIGGNSNSNNKSPLLIDANALDAFAAIAINAPEGMLQFAHYSDMLIAQLSVTANQYMECPNGGRRLLTLNQPLPLIAGSIITDQLDNCEVKALDAVMNGEVIITITQQQLHDATNTLTFTMDLTKAVIKDTSNITVLDPVTVKLTAAPLLKTFEVFPATERVRFLDSDGDEFSLSQFHLLSELNVATAQYRNDFKGRFSLKQFSQSLLINTAQALQGFFGEYPFQGHVELTDSKNNVLRIKANGEANSDKVALQLNQSAASFTQWNVVAEGAYWHWPGFHSSIPTKRYRQDNFYVVGVLGAAQLNDFPSNGTLSFLFSRPVMAINTQQLRQFFSNQYWGQFSVDADVEVAGAIVHFTPKTPLVPGQQYRVESFEAINLSGKSTFSYISTQLKTSKAVIAVLDKAAGSVSPGSSIELSAAQSVVADGLAVTYQWQELTSHGVVFADPTSAVTVMHVPETLDTNTIKVSVTVTDQLGRSHSASSSLYYLDDLVTALYVNNEADWLISARDVLLTAETAAVTALSGTKQDLYVLFEQSIQHDAIWWEFVITTLAGNALKPGLYLNAVGPHVDQREEYRLTFAASGVFSCSFTTGWFEIFELNFVEVTDQYGFTHYDIDLLSVDFVQYCEKETRPLRGKIRINSNKNF